jgi:predicted HAD superfamily Cof-like phosphohydrolase
MRVLEDFLAAFHEAAEEVSFIERDAEGRKRFLDLRMSLITEEYKELMDELLDARNEDGDALNLAKEMADLAVVLIGTAQLMDIPFTRVFEEVMKSNLSKVSENGKILRREDGKILKPETYRPADLSFLQAVAP